jgi:benzoyl-CoA reductase/2-hydroxyglutaryl-CoA dehydratase subunit BcrC/BadD/HgdB
MDFSLRTDIDDNFFYFSVANVTIAFFHADIDKVIGKLENVKKEIRKNEKGEQKRINYADFDGLGVS